MCNTTSIFTECNLVANISQEGTIIQSRLIQSQFMYQRDSITQKVNGTISWKYIATSHEKCVVDGIGGRAKSIVRWKFMSKNDDVIVQSSQLMPATTVLYVSQADIDSVTIIGSENCQSISFQNQSFFIPACHDDWLTGLWYSLCIL